MCVIVVKPKGVKMPSKNVLRRCHKRNDDGAGFAIKRRGEIIISKGFFKFGTLMQRLGSHRITEDDELLIHFRISTSGEINWACSHPFPVSTDMVELKKDENKTDFAVAHNGVIREYNHSKVVSDTMLFIQDMVAKPEIKDNLYESNAIRSLLKEFIGSSKLAFLHKDKGLLMIGNFQEHEGCFFSNDSYKKHRVVTTYRHVGGAVNYNVTTGKYERNDKSIKRFNSSKGNYCDACNRYGGRITWHNGYQGFLCSDCIVYRDQYGLHI